MGKEAVSPSEETQDKPNDVTKPTDAEATEKEAAEKGGEESQEAPESQDAKDGEGETLSPEDAQREIDKAVQKRLKREKRKSAKGVGEAAKAAEDLVIEKEKNKLLTLALEQKTDATKAANLPPNPDDFDGVSDPKYLESVQAYNQKITQALVQDEVRRATADISVTQNEGEKKRNFEHRNTEHIRKSIALDASDYDVTEDAVIDIIGQDNVDHIISASDDAHLVLYYLGKNVDKAENLQDLIMNDPLKAAVQIGRLEAIAKGSPIVNANPTPDPDEELSGGSPSAGKTNKHQRAVDAARKKAGETRDMGPLLDAKKAAREDGVSVE